MKDKIIDEITSFDADKLYGLFKLGIFFPPQKGGMRVIFPHLFILEFINDKGKIIDAKQYMGGRKFRDFADANRYKDLLECSFGVEIRIEESDCVWIKQHLKHFSFQELIDLLVKMKEYEQNPG